MLQQKIKGILCEWLVLWASVFVLYQMLWTLIYNFPARFYEKHDFIMVNLKFLFLNAIYCAVALFIAYKSVWFARQKRNLTLVVVR